jgi:predicted ATP-dependent serine protease
VSLTGKVRYVLLGEKRIQELDRRGFPQILVPAKNAEEYLAGGGARKGLKLEAVIDVAEAVKYATARSGGA